MYQYRHIFKPTETVKCVEHNLLGIGVVADDMN